MSGFVQQHQTESAFVEKSSWVIMSSVEKSIQQKINKKGIPLSEWDICINYGIKTGYNDAFIISSEKRNEILSACSTETERQKTDELIRPSLSCRPRAQV